MFLPFSSSCCMSFYIFLPALPFLDSDVYLNIGHGSLCFWQAFFLGIAPTCAPAIILSEAAGLFRWPEGQTCGWPESLNMASQNEANPRELRNEFSAPMRKRFNIEQYQEGKDPKILSQQVHFLAGSLNILYLFTF